MLNPFQNTYEQGTILQVVSKPALIAYLQGDEHCIYPFETNKSEEVSTYLFELTEPDIYDLYLNGIMQNQFDSIYVIPKEERINKYLFDYRYAVK